MIHAERIHLNQAVCGFVLFFRMVTNVIFIVSFPKSSPSRFAGLFNCSLLISVFASLTVVNVCVWGEGVGDERFHGHYLRICYCDLNREFSREQVNETWTTATN